MAAGFKMIIGDSTDFDDSIELGNDILADSLENSTLSDAVPLKSIVKLSEIWIPSKLLVPEKTVTNFGIKNTVFHTLQKPCVTDRFSLYSEECVGEEKQEEWTNRNSCTNSSTLKDWQGNKHNGNSSYLVSLLPSSSQLAGLRDREQSTSSNFDDITNEIIGLMTNVSEDLNEKPNTKSQTNVFLDYVKCNTQQINQGKPVESFSEELKDSLEDLYYSDDDCFYKNDDIELLQAGNNSKEKNIDVCSEAHKSSDINVLQSNNTETETSQEFFTSEHIEEVEVPVVEEVVEFNIPYIRPALEDNISTKPKTKKKKKASKKKVIENFLDNSYDAEERGFEEFYKSIMEKKDKKISKSQEFPILPQFQSHPVNATQTQDSFYNTVSPIDLEENSVTNNSSQDDDKTIIDALYASKEINGGSKIVITNFPSWVTEDDVKNIVSNFASVQKISLFSNEDYTEAHIWVDSTEVDWIIECLEDSPPFGAPDDYLLVCYKST